MKKLIYKIIKTNSSSLPEILSNSRAIYTFLNPTSYIEARKNKNLFRKFDGIFVDGNLLVKYIYLFYSKKIQRQSFDMTSFVPSFFKFCIQNNKTIYIVASKKEEITNAINIFKENYPQLNIIGYRNGYFKSQEEKDFEFNKILSINPDFLIVGMGIINQEKFLIDIKNKGFNGIGFTCGGFISQTSKCKIKADYYPLWINKYNLRFLYRIYKEKHTRKRYLKAFFIFPILFLIDKLS